MASEQATAAAAAEAVDAPVPVVTLHAGDFPIDAATVYVDRADVSRTLRTKLAKGMSQIDLVDVGPLDTDTIRVSGTGAATIVDVKFESKRVDQFGIADDDQADSDSDADDKPDDPGSNSTTNASSETDEERERRERKAKRAELLKQKKALLRKIREQGLEQRRLEAEKENLTQHRELIDKFRSSVLSQPAAQGSGAAVAKSSTVSASQSWDTQVSGFFGTFSLEHQRTLKRIGIAIIEIDERLEQEWTTRRTISVLVSTTEDDVNVELDVSYMVHNASWKPSYDIRVQSEAQQFELTYKAEISQSTEEVWKDAKITLSTAKPAIGGDIPKFSSPWHLSIYVPPVTRVKLAKKSGMSFGASARFSSPPMQSQALLGEMSKMSSMPRATAQASQGVTSATFAILARNTIPPDGVGHKVTISIINLKPTFEFATVPKIAERVYLRAKVKNESDFALLQGPCAVYLDGSFVAKSDLGKSVSPFESFDVSLGVDPSIVVTYSPIKKQVTETGNSLLGNRTAVHKYTQSISVKNTKQVAISITVTDQVPMSEDDKIKVTLLAPEPQSLVTVESIASRDEPTDAAGSDGQHSVPTGPIRIFQDTNILEFRLDIPPSSSKEITLRYDVAYPTKDTIYGL
ncbi:hypothetical protein BC831DRAFT_551945 [Entophlyctis helioformis]|nr:hypothetical protein BC831DRAFT_551945 [Entophlyctis helioformis]